MQKVRATSPVTFAAGTRLALTERQAASRQHALLRVSKGVFETTQPVQFKAGEEFGVDGDVPKALFESLEGEGIPSPGAPDGKSPKKPKAAKKADSDPEPVAPAAAADVPPVQEPSA